LRNRADSSGSKGRRSGSGRSETGNSKSRSGSMRLWADVGLEAFIDLVAAKSVAYFPHFDQPVFHR
jgi:hypothetical protein